MSPLYMPTIYGCLEDDYNCNPRKYIRNAKRKEEALMREIDFLEKLLILHLNSSTTNFEEISRTSFGSREIKVYTTYYFISSNIIDMIIHFPTNRIQPGGPA